MCCNDESTFFFQLSTSSTEYGYGFIQLKPSLSSTSRRSYSARCSLPTSVKDMFSSIELFPASLQQGIEAGLPSWARGIGVERERRVATQTDWRAESVARTLLSRIRQRLCSTHSLKRRQSRSASRLRQRRWSPKLMMFRKCSSLTVCTARQYDTRWSRITESLLNSE